MAYEIHETRRRSKRGGSCQRECVRKVLEPYDHKYSREFSSRSLQQGCATEYPRTYGTEDSSMWPSSQNARSSENYPGNYTPQDQDVHPSQLLLQPNFCPPRFHDAPSFSNYHLTDNVVLDQRLVQSSLPQSRRHPGNPSYSNYHALNGVVLDQQFSQHDHFPQHGRRSVSPFPQHRRRSGSPSYSKYRPPEDVDEPSVKSSFPRRRRPSFSPLRQCRKRSGSPSYSHMADYAVLDQPVSRSSYPKRGRPSGTPSYSGFRPESRDTTKYKSHSKARHPRDSDKDHQHHAKRRQENHYTRDLSPEKTSRSGHSSQARKERPSSKSGFEKLIAKRVKFNDQAIKSDEPYNAPKVPKLAFKIVNSANKIDVKCSNDNGKVDPANNSANKIDAKSFNDNGEVDPSAAKLATKSSKDDAEVSLKKDSADQLKSSIVDHTECEKQNNEADDVPHEPSYHPDSKMQDLKIKRLSKEDSRKDLSSSHASREDDSSYYVVLMKDHKVICRTKCENPPVQPSSPWNVDIVKKKLVKGLYDLPHFLLFPAVEGSVQKLEWIKFLTFLSKYDRVATVKFDDLKIHVYPPDCKLLSEAADGLDFPHAVVAYELQELCDTSVGQKEALSVVQAAQIKTSSFPPTSRSLLDNEGKECPRLHSIPQTPRINDAPAFESVDHVKKSSSAEKGTCSSISKCQEDDIAAERNFVRADPSYLKTLGQAHSGWIFGAIAELVDNSRDASASRLDIAIETIYDKTVGCEIPMLSIIDDGVGMNHQEILRMISFGHKQPEEDNSDCIGRFGIGFKTGSMRLGRDALVLTQTTHSRSIAFLSQSLNEGKDNLEIPVVSYRRQAQFMEFDTCSQSVSLAKYNLNAMKEFSPFDEYLIGEKAGLFQHFQRKTGTQIYIWNLDKWGSVYTLEWQEGMRGGSSFHQGDIFIRSRRVRTRPGQISRKVHLDYSLRSYLEVIFLEPRMKIYVQDSLVKSRPLAKSLNKTAVINDEIMGKQVQLTLGRCQVEWDEANSGIFLYWHGRLIEAYKRVGGMIHSADMGRGVIGVVDVTELMDDGNGGVWVHSNKQGFQDCEPYACLEEWLGKTADDYWDANFDAVQLKKRNARYKPDNEWVQCDKCRKWRLLNGGFDSNNLPKEWFCYMEPFNGRCETPEQKVERGVITVGLKRASDNPSVVADCKGGFLIDDDIPAVKDSQDEPTTEMAADDEEHIPQKRLRRGPSRNMKQQDAS